MTAARSATSPTCVTELGPGADGARIRQFSVGAATVQVTAPAGDVAAAELTARLHLFCSVPPALASPGSPWRRVRVGPGVEAAVRDTPKGDVLLLITHGELTVTEGVVELAVTILDADRRAVQTRAAQSKRRTRRASKRGAR